MAIVKLPSLLRQHVVNNLRELEVPGSTVQEILQNLVVAQPELQSRIYDEAGELRRFLNISVDDEDVRYLDDLDTKVSDRQVVDLIANVAGG